MAKLHELGGEQNLSARLGSAEPQVIQALDRLRQEHVLSRVWERDHTVWKPQPDEIANRLGWLDTAGEMLGRLAELDSLRAELAELGWRHVLLLGMGGSSLAPELFGRVFGGRQGACSVEVLDTTDPDAVRARSQELDPASTLYIVSSKSGGTVETASLFKFFYNQAAEALGADQAGAHFVAITDQGSKLAAQGSELGFKRVFYANPEIGGRYSALSHFGLVPAALAGVDLALLLARAQEEAGNCGQHNCPWAGDNRGGRLGAIMGCLAGLGRDKLTVVTSPSIASFGGWVEQLIAESTGKEGRGILPVVGEELGEPGLYGPDRLFVYLRLEGEYAHDARLMALEEAGHPVVWLRLRDLYDLGAQFFLWEMATAVAGYFLGINPFDQPNVESAKVRAKQMVAAYEKEGRLPGLEPSLSAQGITVYGPAGADRPGRVLADFARATDAAGYLGLQAYLTPGPELDQLLARMQGRLRRLTGRPVTVGYGPRFLHSTGQLHKGDAGKGRFIQLTADSAQEAAIPDQPGSPDSALSFGVLKEAQALGDRQALLDAGRQVLRLHLGDDAPGRLAGLLEDLG